MNLLVSLRSEILKTKRTAAFYLTIVAGAIGPVMSMLDLIFDGVPQEDRYTILNKMFTAKFQMTSFLLLPMFVILICTLLPQIEYRNNAWKQVLASPQSKGNVFIAKFLNIHLLIFMFLLTNQLSMFITVIVLQLKEPSLNVLGQPINSYEALMTPVRSYLTILAMSSIQFWLGLRFRNFILPIGVGITLWFCGAILVLEYKSTIAPYFPYSFHVYPSFPKYASQLGAVQWTSLYLAALFLMLGFIDFSKRRMNG